MFRQCYRQNLLSHPLSQDLFQILHFQAFILIMYISIYSLLLLGAFSHLHFLYLSVCLSLQPVVSLCFSPNGNFLASASLDCSASIWELEESTDLERGIPSFSAHLFATHEDQQLLCESNSLAKLFWMYVLTDIFSYSSLLILFVILRYPFVFFTLTFQF